MNHLVILVWYRWRKKNNPDLDELIKEGLIGGFSEDFQEVDPSELELGPRIGKGSFAEVFRAKWRGTTIAVKKLPAHMVGEEFFDDFEQEADLMKRLRHPNVLQFLGIYSVPPFPSFSFFSYVLLCSPFSFWFSLLCCFVYPFSLFLFAPFSLSSPPPPKKQRHYLSLSLSLLYFLFFVGACLMPPDICILMEYMPKGSLYRILHSPTDLPWDLLLRMALDAARGMNYLHCSEPQVLHRDLKSHNLLVRAHLPSFPPYLLPFLFPFPFPILFLCHFPCLFLFLFLFLFFFLSMCNLYHLRWMKIGKSKCATLVFQGTFPPPPPKLQRYCIHTPFSLF